MYGLRHKHIRIEDQQLILKMNIIPKVYRMMGDKTQVLLENFTIILYLLNKLSTPKLLFYKLTNEFFNYTYSGL